MIKNLKVLEAKKKKNFESFIANQFTVLRLIMCLHILIYDYLCLTFLNGHVLNGVAVFYD